MNQKTTKEIRHSLSSQNREIYYRLIALWVLCEAMLGGVIHALKIPVSGLIVGSAAVICICLIAYYVPGKAVIIKATIIVAIFKMILSPQAPVLAYLAVFFQGGMGELLFLSKRFFRFSCLLLGLIAMLESGLQRIIVLTIVYGNNFWKAINDFISTLSGQKTFTNYSLYIAIAYVTVHILTGLVVGWWAGIIPNQVLNWRNKYQKVFIIPEKNKEAILSPNNSKKNKFRKGMFIVWMILLLLYLQSYFKIGNTILPPRLPIQILTRSVLIILTWYFLIGPLISLLLKKWLSKRQSASKREIMEVTQLLPSIKTAMNKSWKAASTTKGIKRIILCCKLILVYTLYPLK